MKRQRGAIALVFALLIAALVAAFVSEMVWHAKLQTRRTQSSLWQEQARLVALGAEGWVRDVLRQDLENSEIDFLGEVWAQELPPLPLSGPGIEGVVLGQLEDMEGRFNLNNLIDNSGQPVEVEVERFRRLLQSLELDPQIAEAIMDWADGDVDTRFPGGAEDEIYTARIPPMRAPNLAFRSTSELAMIEGIPPEALIQLLPQVTALPERSTINVNTAPPLVLQILDDNLTSADIQQIIEERAEIGIEDPAVNFAGILDPDVIATLGTSTRYFLLRSLVRIGTTRFTMYSLLHRSSQGQVAVVQRSFGTPP